jgi:Phage integrase, N-terminal SAM-like domain
MARKPTGHVMAPDNDRRRSYALRFRAYGERRFITLGRPEDGWTQERAEAKLRHILADVERGIWQPDEAVPAPDVPKAEPTFHEFATDWLRNGEPEWRPKTIVDYRWALELHLLPYFAQHRLSEITAEEIDRYKGAKLRERKLAPNAINKTITRLAQILEVAVEYKQLEHNPPKTSAAVSRAQSRNGPGSSPSSFSAFWMPQAIACAR